MFKFTSEKYLRSTIVLGIDTVTSILASALVLLFGYYIKGNNAIGSSHMLGVWLTTAGIASLIAFYFTRVYQLVIRFSTIRELSRVCLAVIAKEILMVIGMGIFEGSYSFRLVSAMLALDFLITVGALLLVRVLMLWIYYLVSRARPSEHAEDETIDVLVYGIGAKSASVLTRLRTSPHYRVVGFLAPDDVIKDTLLMGKPIYYFHDEEGVKFVASKSRAKGILFAYHLDAHEEQDRLIPYCQNLGLKMFIAPSIDEMTDGKMATPTIRKIKIEDLLGRSEIKINMKEIRDNFQGKTVLVTGAAGSIGSELCRQLAGLGVKHLVMFDNGETPLHNVRLEFEDKYPNLYFTPVIGDVRQPARLDYVFRKYRPQVVFHAAAYKHVPLMEENPCEAVMANVQGSRNVADKCVEYEAEKMVMISTDKAVNPTNIMGCTKRLAEIYVQSLGLAIEKGLVKGKTQFVTTRFGNVLGSNGSVIPRFTEQIERGGPVTVTDPQIRRFFMTIPEACRLVMEAATIATGTQIFVFDMGTPIKIDDLARRMISLAGFVPDKDIAVEYTGLRPGEKLYEEVLATKENTIPTDHDRIFVAKVRDYEYENARATSDELYDLASRVEIPDMVKLMKRTVPEFISRHSVFEIYDRKDPKPESLTEESDNRTA
ncbi:MAG: polysaccharide biosynthesis protein [Muribaculaceae bacterium]|nr:polysaccharide biosynthesis protein [Muribaculaceae bacterium]MDE6448043.1 polysaccharide biosynthesis protein [Muribaculaceae bacterium]